MKPSSKFVVPAALSAVALFVVLSGTTLATATTQFDSLRVGKANQGGVTFFNGSIVNESGPVTVADDLRVDGVITRLNDDAKPVKVGDDLEVEGDVTFDEREGHVSIHGSAFIGEDGDLGTYGLRNGLMNQQGAQEETSYFAPVQVPHGAELNRMAAWMYDSDASRTLHVKLHRIGKDGSAEDSFSSSNDAELAAVSSGGNQGTVSQTDSFSHEVDNLRNTYVLEATFPTNTGTNLRLQGVSLRYTYTAP